MSEHSTSVDELKARLNYYSDDDYINLRNLFIKYRKDIFEKYFFNKKEHQRIIPPSLLAKLYPHELVLLEESRLIERRGGYQYISQFRVHYIDKNDLPFLDEPVIITTDFPLEHTDRVFPWVDEGKLMMKNICSRIPSDTQTILNMCCGTGTIAILLAKLLQNNQDIQIEGVDINPRAVAISQFNQRLNSLGLDASNTTIKFTTGDMFSELADSKYDLIVADPPFALQPPSISEYNHSQGGAYGEEKIELFVKGVKQHLDPIKGQFYLLAYSLGHKPEDDDKKPRIRIKGLLKSNNIYNSEIIPLPKNEPVWRFGDRKQVAINPMPVQYMSIRCGDPTYLISESPSKINEYIKWIEEDLVQPGLTHLYYLIVHYFINDDKQDNSI